MVGFSSLPGERRDKNETVTAFLLPFPHRVRQTTGSQETLMPCNTVPQLLLAFSGGNSCLLLTANLLQGISRAALPLPDLLLRVRVPKMQPCP